MNKSIDGEERRFLVLDDRDNTVTALKDLVEGEEVALNIGDETAVVVIARNIPYAHKFARVDIPKGGDVVKYGEVIGAATENIRQGDHVHVHNVESKRARGDIR